MAFVLLVPVFLLPEGVIRFLASCISRNLLGRESSSSVELVNAFTGTVLFLELAKVSLLLCGFWLLYRRLSKGQRE